MLQSRILLTLVFSLGMLFPAAAAQSQSPETRVLVLRFSGPDGNSARRAAVTGLEGSYDLEPYRNATSRAREDGVRLSDPTARARVATELNVDLMVRGEVTGRGARAVTTITVEDTEGVERSRREAPGPGSASGRQAIATATAEAVAEATGSGAGAGAAAGAGAGAGGGTAAEAGTETGATAGAETGATAGAETGAAAGAEPAARPTTEDEASPLRTRTPRVLGYLGVGIRSRDADIEYESADHVTHSVPSFATLSLRFESFFLGDSGEDQRLMRGFYGRADFHTSLGFRTTNSAGEEIDTSFYDFMVHAGWFYPFERGKAGLLVGWGMQSTKFDEGIDYPDVTFNQLRVAAGGGYDIVRDYLTVGLEYGVQIPFTNDDLTLHGEKTLSVGLDFILSLEGRLDLGFAYALRFGWERYNYDFFGDPAPTYEAAIAGHESGVWLDLQVGWVWD